jgi:hypothetical protein
MFKNKNSMYKNQVSKKRRYAPIGIAVLAVVFVAGILGYKHYTNANRLPDAVTTSKAKTAQSDYSDGAPRETNTSGSNNNGGVVDKKGQSDNSSLPSPDKWTSSSSGAVTLQRPTAGEVVKSGDTISGTATTSTVQYRLVDDKYGVIGQGSLNVVDGKFAGALQFTSSHTTGTINIFSLDPASGAEINSAKIKVSYE